MRVARLLSVKHWLLFVALAGMYVVANSAGAEAVCLTTSWQFPEQACGSRATWTVTELCSTNTSSCMKGAVNEVLIYVPNALVGTNVTVNIVDGCDDTPSDRPGGANTHGVTATTHYMVTDGGSALLSSGSPTSDDFGCPNNGNNGRRNIPITFFASPAGPVDGNYHYYFFIALGGSHLGDGSSWYSNNYRLETSPSSGVTLGMTGDFVGPLSCPTGSWPYSCPGSQLAYSTISAWNRSGSWWNYAVSFAAPCTAPATLSGYLKIYDPDHLRYQNNMTLFLDVFNRATQAPLFSITPVPAGVLINGGNDTLWQYPSGPPFTFTNTQILRATITGIGDPNTLQIQLAGTSNSANQQCGPVVPVVATYDFSLSAQTQVPVFTAGDDEQPTAASFSSSVGFSGGASQVNGVNTRVEIFSNRGGSYNGAAATLTGGVNQPIGAPNPVTNTITVSTKPAHSLGAINRGGIPALQPGDLICVRLTVSPTSGQVTAAGVIQPGASGTSTSVQCRPVVNRPYARFYGNDIAAGSGFMALPATTCTGGTGRVNAFNRPSGVGASSQLGIFADSVVSSGNVAAGVSNVASMMLRDALSGSFNNRIFANTGTLGNFGSTICAYSYPDPPSFDSAGPVGGVSSSMTGKYRLNPPATGLAVNNFSGRTALYANSNVRISGNISFSNTPTTVDNLPSFVLIVKGADIYIDSGVTQLDGIYIAMPVGGTGGRIFTCSNNGWPSGVPSAGQLTPPAGSCSQNSLTVNGAFIAQKVNFLRTKGTLRLGAANETYSSNNPGAPAAEIFRYSPEMFMANSALPAYETSDSIQSILGLPPSL